MRLSGPWSRSILTDSVHGIYVTLNEVNPALLSRRANRIKMRLGKKDSTTSDADILRRRWLPIDIDPLRPSGVSSTDVEHGLALAKADEVARSIAGLGFPDPVRADPATGLTCSTASTCRTMKRQRHS